jgi:hypothetical protein
MSTHRSLSQLAGNQLRWLPVDLDRLPTTTIVRVRSFSSPCAQPSWLALSQLEVNPLPLSFEDYEDARPRLAELFSVTTHIGMIRERATAVCFAMQDLELPAPLTLEIIDALCPNNIRMWAKWELITMVKHFHQRHERSGRPHHSWNFDFMADFVVETTNERGVVERERVSMNETKLHLSYRRLVRIDGLELKRETLKSRTLKTLFVRRPINAFLVSSLICSLVSFSSTATVLSTCLRVCSRWRDSTFSTWVSFSSFCFLVVVADSSAALRQPLVVSARCHWPHDGVDRALCVDWHRARSRCLTGTVF